MNQFIPHFTPLGTLVASVGISVMSLRKTLFSSLIRPAVLNDTNNTVRALEQRKKGENFVIPQAFNETDNKTDNKIEKQIIIALGGNGYTFDTGFSFSQNRHEFISTFYDGLSSYDYYRNGRNDNNFNNFDMYYFQPGYHTDAQTCIDQIKNTVREIQQEHPKTKIALMGLSLGGGFATQAALQIAEENQRNQNRTSNVDLINVRSFSRTSDTAVNILLRSWGQNIFGRFLSSFLDKILKYSGNWNLNSFEAIGNLIGQHGYSTRNDKFIPKTSNTSDKVNATEEVLKNQNLVVTVGWSQDSLLGSSSIVNFFKPDRACTTKRGNDQDHNSAPFLGRKQAAL